MQSKTPENSKTIQTDLVLPGDTNSLNSLFGGELLARMDRVASIAAIKHSEQIVVTASVNNVSFGEPVPVGSILTIEAKVSRAFSSSMEVFIDVWKQNKTNPKMEMPLNSYTIPVTLSNHNSDIHRLRCTLYPSSPLELPPGKDLITICEGFQSE